jgi:hypothetical protein
MRLGLRMLNNASTVNNLMYINQVRINPGETCTVIFQLVDLDSSDNPALAQRYIPASGSTVNVGIYSINQANNLTKIPTNPFVDDRSIWSFNLSTADTNILAGVNMTITLTEGSNVKVATGQSVIVVGPKSFSQC